MENRVFIESFLNYQEAFDFFEGLLIDFGDEEWELQDTAGIQYMNKMWRVGFAVARKRPMEGDIEQVIKDLEGHTD